MATIASLVDDFNGSSLNATLWPNVAHDAGASHTVASGQVNLVAPPGKTAQFWGGPTYDFDGGTFVMRRGSNAFANDSAFYIQFADDTFINAAYLGVEATAGVIRIFCGNANGNSTQTVWDMNYQYIRLRMGVTTYIDWSQDSRTWTNIGTSPVHGAPPPGRVYISLSNANASATAQMAISSFNILQGASQGATHAHTVSSPTITHNINLISNGATHAHSVDNVTVQGKETIVSNGATHGHTVNNVTLSFAIPLVAQNTTHGHTAQNVTLTSKQVLVVNGATHSQSVTAPTLTQKHSLIPSNTLHAHTVGNVALTQKRILTISGAVHAHFASSTSVLIQVPSGVNETGSYVYASGAVGHPYPQGTNESGNLEYGGIGGGMFEETTNDGGTWNVV